MTLTWLLSTFPAILGPAENSPSMVQAQGATGGMFGTIRYGGVLNVQLFGQPAKVPCKIMASGSVNDPINGKPTGAHAVAWGFVTNRTFPANYEAHGIPPGSYKVTAICAGFAPFSLDHQITLTSGMSLYGVDFFIWR